MEKIKLVDKISTVMIVSSIFIIVFNQLSVSKALADSAPLDIEDLGDDAVLQKIDVKKNHAHFHISFYTFQCFLSLPPISF